jgi:nicotinamidase-related amidase
MDCLNLSAQSSALVLIDLQQAVVGRSVQPTSASDVVQRCRKLAELFRQKSAMVVYVRVDLANFRSTIADQTLRPPGSPPPPPNASELVPEAGFQPGDVLITKRFWGAFGGTNLENELRQRGIETIVLGGISTNFGVESTARTAAELGFNVVLLEDAMSSMEAEMHRFTIEKIFPRLGRVRKAEQIRLV